MYGHKTEFGVNPFQGTVCSYENNHRVESDKESNHNDGDVLVDCNHHIEIVRVIGQKAKVSNAQDSSEYNQM